MMRSNNDDSYIENSPRRVLLENDSLFNKCIEDLVSAFEKRLRTSNFVETFYKNYMECVILKNNFYEISENIDTINEDFTHFWERTMRIISIHTFIRSFATRASEALRNANTIANNDTNVTSGRLECGICSFVINRRMGRSSIATQTTTETCFKKPRARPRLKRKNDSCEGGEFHMDAKIREPSYVDCICPQDTVRAVYKFSSEYESQIPHCIPRNQWHLYSLNFINR